MSQRDPTTAGADRMWIVGLTGSIGMGKSTTARLFAEAGCAVYDADAAVHGLYAQGGQAVAPVGARFPGVVIDGAIDREKLAQALRADISGFEDLEAIVHPLTRQAQTEFIREARAAGHKVAVLDIPLLFETGGDAHMDAVVVVTAPPEVQRDRVLARPQMTEDKFQAILARQMPDAEKRTRADFVIDTSRGLEAARQAVHDILEDLKQRTPPHA